MTYWTIRLTEYHKNKEEVIAFVKEYWNWYFIVLETSAKDKEHYHILINETSDIERDALRKRMKKHGYSGNRQYNLKELDEQRINSEWIPYMCKEQRKRYKNITWFAEGYKPKIKKMRKIYEKRAKEYKNGVLKRISDFINSENCCKEKKYKYGELDYIGFVIQYYIYEGLCVPSQWRCISLAQTLMINENESNKMDTILSLASNWYERSR